MNLTSVEAQAMNRGHLAAAVAAAALSFGAPAVANADSNFPPVGWWPMNEGSGQVVRDWSFHGNDGTLGTTPGPDAQDPSWIKGVFLGSALRFDGNDDIVTIPASKSLQPQSITVAAWVRSTGSPGKFRYIVSKGSNACTSSSYGLYTGANGGLIFYTADSTTHYNLSRDAGSSVWDGNWHNVAGTFDGSTVRLFVDGNEIGSGAPASGPIDYSFSDETADIGNAVSTCPDALTLRGDVDGVQIWSQALPVAKIWATLKSLFTTSR
jgi:hypothetical protein